MTSLLVQPRSTHVPLGLKIVPNWNLVESLLNHFLLLPRFLLCVVKDLAEIPTSSLDLKFQGLHVHSNCPKC